MFANSVEGAKASAIIYSLQQTCKAQGVEPYAYFKTVLANIVHCKNETDYQALLPQNIDREQLLTAYQ